MANWGRAAAASVFCFVSLAGPLLLLNISQSSYSLIDGTCYTALGRVSDQECFIILKIELLCNFLNRYSVLHHDDLPDKFLQPCWFLMI